MAAAMAAALIANLVLIGWTFDVDLLKRVIPGLVAMNPMTALTFLIGAISKPLDIKRFLEVLERTLQSSDRVEKQPLAT
jgi:hypothetical protein